MKLKAKHFAWINLLKTGGVGTWSFHGGGFSFDKQLTDLAHHDIMDHGVDWSKTKAPTDSYEDAFAGTFADSHDQTQTMKGTLYTKNGVRYDFDCRFDPENIFRVMEEIQGIESVEQFISEKLFKEL